TQSTNSNNGGEKTGVHCPEQGCDGEVVQRSSKRGKIFYGCSRFPDCTFATWDKPVAKECPECGAKYLIEKTTKKQGTFLVCNTKGCGFKITSE
ncbi:MAG TPA: type I DNA topoisomerase, partial [Desulfobacterales bacterium]|nr:type I DNA topoisomerase [Desulfobacterales bacterium]